MALIALTMFTAAACTPTKIDVGGGTPPSAPIPFDPDVAASWPAPDQSLTPGDVIPSCTYPRPASQRYVSAATRNEAISSYGYVGSTGITHVELDHRVPFSLCGGNDVRNVWPEPYDGVNTSLYVHNRKDQLELFVARQVRDGGFTLTFAQNLFLNDWRAAWCAYVGPHYPSIKC
jgi:hypothetical protein